MINNQPRREWRGISLELKMQDLYPDFQNVLTLLNKLAKNTEEQTQLAENFRKAWEIGDATAAAFLGKTLTSFAERL